jgi:ArsR family transcriptional regulator, lead/cadmium/zinc/bismuth-responsive transcriptional repressor
MATAAKPKPKNVPTRSEVARMTVALGFASNPTRVLVLFHLGAGEADVGGIVAAVGMTQPAVSHHLRLMRAARLAECRRQGKHNFYSLTAAGERLLRAARELL